ncbi:glycogen debranching N-terminal domain-containing protein [Pseudarthrobacter sp. P1]|uniref:amylo-alpha-1,6-glucosidase n=1 Tax=Pseudarthrobacter sp. P1 TaxID=3418418 RepID=UPI003CEC107E
MEAHARNLQPNESFRSTTAACRRGAAHQSPLARRCSPLPSPGTRGPVMAGWNAENGAGSAGAGAVTLLAGTSFCISAANGDMEPARPHGVFFRDTRFVSGWTLAINGSPVESLGNTTTDPFRANFIGRAARTDGLADSHLLIERRRSLYGGVREELTVRNYSGGTAQCSVALTVRADFADLFEVKDGRTRHELGHTARHDGDLLVIESARQGQHRMVTIAAPGATIDSHTITYQVDIAPQGYWSATLTITPSIDGIGPEADIPASERVLSAALPEERLLAWQSHVPTAKLANDAVAKVLQQSREDLGSLRIFDPDHPGRVVVAAGSPWFMALFGRDSLLTSFMTLPLDPSLALGTLQTLADRQGREVNPRSEEEPGRILHEVRFGASTGLALGGGSAYYGSVDATPLFVTLAGELTRWGFQSDVTRSLLPAVDRALDWIRDYGDADGDGFVEYARATDHGLINQGWKDSWDGINFADGTMAAAPIALCEVQGYVYTAYLSRALMAQDAGDADLAAQWGARAAALKEEFNERFWLPERGYFAIALDRNKQPVDSCASNMGHCLWSGIVDDDKAALVAERLMSKEMFTGWGVRTLASNMAAYNPASYHNGSVWPHDNALIAGGLRHYGFVGAAQRIATGLLDAAEAFGGRLPELFCGLDRTAYPVPVPYPASCSPQAWAAATPIHLMRILLGFDPCLSHGGLWLAPKLPAGFGDVRIGNILLAGSRISVEVSGGSVVVGGLPDSIGLHLGTRKPLSDLLDVHRVGAGQQQED